MPLPSRTSSLAGLALLCALLVVTPHALRAQAPAPLRVAVLDDDIPGLDRALAEFLAAELSAAGVTVTHLTAAELADAQVFGRDTQDVLLLANSPLFPGQARANVTRFLEAGGHLVLLGGHAYSTPVCRARGEWRDREGFVELLRAIPTATPLFSFNDGDVSGWGRGTNKPEHPSRAVAAPGPGGQCLCLELKGLGQWQWDVYAATIAASPP